jgi:hypothetical protein
MIQNGESETQHRTVKIKFYVYAGLLTSKHRWINFCTQGGLSAKEVPVPINSDNKATKKGNRTHHRDISL